MRHKRAGRPGVASCTICNFPLKRKAKEKWWEEKELKDIKLVPCENCDRVMMNTVIIKNLYYHGLDVSTITRLLLMAILADDVSDTPGQLYRKLTSISGTTTFMRAEGRLHRTEFLEDRNTDHIGRIQS